MMIMIIFASERCSRKLTNNKVFFYLKHSFKNDESSQVVESRRFPFDDVLLISGLFEGDDGGVFGKFRSGNFVGGGIRILSESVVSTFGMASRNGESDSSPDEKREEQTVPTPFEALPTPSSGTNLKI